MNNPKAFVLLSGGMDSATALTLAIRMHGPANVHAASFFYGQKHAVELRHARAVVEWFNMTPGQHHIVDMPEFLFAGTGSALVASDNAPMPQKTYEELSESYGPSPTYVPFRNGNLLSQATALAMTYGAEEVWFGAHSEDAHNWAYPDCTPEFIGAMANAIYVGTYHKIRLITPFQWSSKADIVSVGANRGTPFHLTRSCYEAENVSCGKCPTCIGRLHAFAQNGYRDPIMYAIDDSERPDANGIVPLP